MSCWTCFFLSVITYYVDLIHIQTTSCVWIAYPRTKFTITDLGWSIAAYWLILMASSMLSLGSTSLLPREFIKVLSFCCFSISIDCREITLFIIHICLLTILPLCLIDLEQDKLKLGASGSNTFLKAKVLSEQPYEQSELRLELTRTPLEINSPSDFVCL